MHARCCSAYKQQVWEKRCSKHKCEKDRENISDAKCHAYHCRYFWDQNERILCKVNVPIKVLAQLTLPSVFFLILKYIRKNPKVKIAENIFF